MIDSLQQMSNLMAEGAQDDSVNVLSQRLVS
jgi:hypothetical protein